MKNRFLRLVISYNTQLLWRNKMLVAYMLLASVGVLLAVLQNEYGLSWEMIPTATFSSFIPYSTTFLFSVFILLPLSVFGCHRINSWRTFDNVQTIFYHPVGNGEYVWGVTLALWKIIGAFAIPLFLCIGIIHSTINTNTISIYEYVFYFVTMFIPGVVFVTGFTLNVGIWVKRQSIGIVLLLIFWGAYLLNIVEYENVLLDPLGLTLPNVFSEITGHPDLQSYLLQRGCWLTLGLGMIYLASVCFERIPNGLKQKKLPAIIFLILGMAMGVCFWQGNIINANARMRYRNVYAHYADIPKAYLLSESISLEQDRKTIQATATLKLQNQTTQTQEKILLFLNPHLKVNEIKSGGIPLDFKREEQVIEIKHNITANDTLTLTISYSGGIDERICYLDEPEKTLVAPREERHRACRFGKRYVYMTSNLTLLIPEALWYPMTEPPINPSLPYRVTKNFTSYQLHVRSTGKAISQGNYSRQGDWDVFQNDQPLPCLSLCIGDYETFRVSVDSIEYEVDVWKNHIGLWEKLTQNVESEKEEIIRQIREKAEATYRCKYPYKRLKFVEAPIALYSYFREYQEGSELIQPELVFFPERSYNMGLKIGEGKAYNTYSQLESFLLKENISVHPFSWQAIVGLDFFQRTLDFNVYDKKNLQGITPMFKSQPIDILSQEYPCINLVINKMERIPKGQKQDYTQHTKKAIDYLSGKSLREALYDKDIDAMVADAIFALKGEELINLLIANGGRQNDIINFLHDFKQAHFFEQTDLSVLIREFEKKFGWSWEPILQEWYYQNRIPKYITKMEPILLVEQMESGKRKQRIEFAVYNDSDVEGVVSVTAKKRNFETQTEKTEILQAIKIGPRQGKRIVTLEEDVALASITTGISENLPTTFTENATGHFTIDSLARIESISKNYFSQDSNVYLVDNGDTNCEIKQPFRRFIERLNRSQGKSYDQYVNFSEGAIMYATTRWKEYISEYAQGGSIRSFIFKTAGTGKQPVKWTANLPQNGIYEVWAYIPKNAPHNFLLGSAIQRYTISPNGGVDKSVEIAIPFGEWFLLSKVECEAGENSVTLSDKGNEGQIIVADAVKWVYKEPD